MTLRLATLAGVAASVLVAATRAAPPPDPPFTDREVRLILAHGPWPPQWQRDPSNRVSGKSAAIAFGKRLFGDPRLSRDGTIACVTCHQPESAFTDGLPRAQGLAPTDRNTVGLANVRLQRWFGWDGAADNLWAQSLRPLLDPREMGVDPAHVAATVRADADWRRRYRAAFGEAPAADDETVAINVAKALAAYQETLVTGRTPFDDFRDALARGDRKSAARYPESAQRGLRIFVGKGLCNVCHFGPNFTNGEFEEIGVPHFLKAGGVDWGRAQGIKSMLASRFSLLRSYNDDPARASAISARHVELQLRNYGEFRIPSLRNVALTAPYMHNGHLATLTDVVRHYSGLDPNNLHLGPEIFDRDGVLVDLGLPTVLKPLRLTEREIADVVAFLQTLTDEESRKPRKPPAAAVCK